MAIIKYGPLIQDASGNLGGINFVTGARGPVVRKARAPRAARSPAQLQVHASMKELSSAWAALSSFRTDLWRTAAASISSTTRLGLPKTITGRQFFFKHNLPPRAFDPTFLETAPPGIEQTVGPINFFIAVTPAFNWTIRYNTFPDVATTQMRLYCFQPFLSLQTTFASSWIPVTMSTPIAFGSNVRPATVVALGIVKPEETIQFRLIFRTNGKLDSLPQFSQATS